MARKAAAVSGDTKAARKGGRKAKSEVATKVAQKGAAKGAAPKVAKVKAEGTGSGGVIDRSRYSYETHRDTKTASGRASVDNGDPLAERLRGKNAEDVIQLVADNGGTVNPAWKERNQGLARMAAGNVLRSLAKRPEGIKIDGKKLQIAAA